MAFATDQQTLEDLNIFGKQGGDSIYGLFNRTLTRGGAGLLEEWFRHPLSDASLINQRSATIREMAEGGEEFPWKPELFDQAEQYLANKDERTRLSGEERGVAFRVATLVAEDSDQKVVFKGVAALVEILQKAREFVRRRRDDGVMALLAEPGLLPALDARGKLAFEKMAMLDGLLRFRHRELVQRLLRWVYLQDVYISVAKVARQRRFAFAEALPDDTTIVRIGGCYHPLIKNAVANSLVITPESNLVFLTGANMAGKSTFMKSLGIAMFLAHMGLPVPADAMRFSVRDAIYTTINLPDNLGMGASHFYAEVLRVKKMARELSLGKKLFVVIDELFRGTNVRDAYEATVALVTAFAQRRDSAFVVSTHIIEAGDVLRETCPWISCRYLPTRMEGGRPVYTYELQDGITADRHGMVIIINEGILDILEKGTPKIKIV